MAKFLNGLALYLVFACVASNSIAVPILDTVTVEGTEWAQVDLFIGLSRDNVNTVCSSGACSGILNGYDMDGWQWADREALHELFNYYIGSPELGIQNGNNGFFQSGVNFFGLAFLGDGWRPIRNTTIFGFLGDTTAGIVFDSMFVSAIGHSSFFPLSEASTVQVDRNFSALGGWFYRTPRAALPAAPTSFLLCVGISVLYWNSRRRIGVVA